MKSQYLVDISTFELPEIDSAITAFVENQDTYWADDIYRLAIMHRGIIYRVVTCEEGFSDLIPFTEFMHDYGYIDLAKDRGHFKGYSSLFIHKADLRS
ncbi:hypothetical protein BH925_04145 [Rodentibacter pneumotropicus]|uniref:hypothetical protein n=1 Tax=Rodentibacter pneumotropicus TaxID=758 RepID=UPI000988F392|nr:hypothetical protein [Rodentibacter pneumotropicus]OOF60831.1 hypothetical protein BH925_04145 [Rodentibacter pneumotropicus]